MAATPLPLAALYNAQAYLSCMQQKKSTHYRCSDASRDYLECRMSRGLMTEEDLDSLGYAADRRVRPKDIPQAKKEDAERESGGVRMRAPGSAASEAAAAAAALAPHRRRRTVPQSLEQLHRAPRRWHVCECECVCLFVILSPFRAAVPRSQGAHRWPASRRPHPKAQDRVRVVTTTAGAADFQQLGRRPCRHKRAGECVRVRGCARVRGGKSCDFFCLWRAVV